MFEGVVGLNSAPLSFIEDTIGNVYISGNFNSLLFSDGSSQSCSRIISINPTGLVNLTVGASFTNSVNSMVIAKDSSFPSSHFLVVSVSQSTNNVFFTDLSLISFTNFSSLGATPTALFSIDDGSNGSYLYAGINSVSNAL